MTTDTTITREARSRPDLACQLLGRVDRLATRLGGDDLDKRLTDFLLGKIREADGPDLSDPAALPQLSRLREAAELAKIRLSTENETELALPFLTPTFSFSYSLTREALENLTRDLIERTRGHCLRSLADAKLRPKTSTKLFWWAVKLECRSSADWSPSGSNARNSGKLGAMSASAPNSIKSAVLS